MPWLLIGWGLLLCALILLRHALMLLRVSSSALLHLMRVHLSITLVVDKYRSTVANLLLFLIGQSGGE